MVFRFFFRLGEAGWPEKTVKSEGHFGFLGLLEDEFAVKWFKPWQSWQVKKSKKKSDVEKINDFFDFWKRK